MHYLMLGLELLATMKIVVSILKELELTWEMKIAIPEIGERFEFVEIQEIKIEVTFEKHLQSKILKAFIQIMFMKK
jgi:hypothetical protein